MPVQSNFTVECYGRQPLQWNLPDMWKIVIQERTVITSYFDKTRTNPHSSLLTVTDIHSTDTGLYSCYYENTTDFQDKATVTSIYLFANDPEYLFVSNKQWGFNLFPSVIYGPESIIPCLPTHSNTNVTLITPDLRAFEFNEKLQFDPMRGMVLRYPTEEFSGVLNCRAQHYDKITDLQLFIIYYGDTSNAPEPIIEKIGAVHAVVNGTYKLRCIARASYQARIDMKFEYPARNFAESKKRITEGELMVDSGALDSLGTTKVYTDLIINDVQPIDEGTYKCVVSDHMQKTGSAVYFVDVLDSNPPAFVNLTTDLIDPIEMRIGMENFRFVVKYFVYPSRKDAEFVWRKDDKVLDDQRHIVTELKNSTQFILTIKKLKREDTGTYVLTARTKDQTTNVTIKLLVTEKPSTEIINGKRYLGYGANYQLLCGAVGSPVPIVWWTWKECTYEDHCQTNDYRIVPSEWQTYLDKSQIDKERFGENYKEYSAASILNIYAAESAYYRCNADNVIGSNASQPHLTIVSWAMNGLEIGQTVEEPIDGDNVTLICRANVFQFNDINWYWMKAGSNQSNRELVPENLGEKAHIDTVNTLQSSLFFKPIRVDYAGTYICSAINSQTGVQHQISTQLNIQDVEMPQFNETNLLNNEMTVEKTREFEFYCYVSGVPPPLVTWLKNDVEFNISSMPGVVMMDNRQKIIINRLVESDTGNYKCLAENRVGIISASLSLNVDTDVVVATTPKPPRKAFIGMVAGIVFCVVLFISVGAVLMWRVYKDRKLKLDLELEGFKHFEQGRLDMYNPDLPLDDQAELLPYDKRWEFPKERLVLGKTLGQGAFGRVVQAEAIGITEYENSTTVAVKMLKEKSDKTQLKALVAELKIMIHLGKHLNVVNLLGAVTRNIARGELMLLAEYCKYGNLRHYLLHQRRNFINQISSENGEIDVNITSQSCVIGRNRKISVHTTENDQAEKQLHYADIVHAYKRGLTREISRTSDDGKNVRNGNSIKSTRSGSNASNNMHKTALERTLSTGTDGRTRIGSDGSVTFAVDDVYSDNSGSASAAADVFSQSGMSYKYKGDLKDTPINTCDLLCYSFQISRGMQYLSSKKLIHRDLAARNILLAEDNVVKICDFGLAKDCYKYSNYVKKGDGPLPIKWMAIESIRDKVFTTQTDVWSYGILLWEIFALGANPYPGIEIDEEFFKKLKNGYRMEKPEFCPNSVFKLMEDCWEAEPIDRPNFVQIADRTGDLLEGSMKQYYIELNNPYLLMNEELENNNDYLQMEGKDRDSNYLNMRGSAHGDNIDNDQSCHYDNIRSVRPVGVNSGEQIILKPPMEIVPMIQFGDGHLDVRPTDFYEQKKVEDEQITQQLTDYVYMGSPKKKEFNENPFTISRNKCDDRPPPPAYVAAVSF